MHLRTRILLAYGYLVTLLVISAAGAALGFQQLGASIGRVLSGSVEEVQAAVQMLEALERQDSAVLALLLGEDEAREAVDRSEKAFAQALALAESSASSEEERRAVVEIEQRLASYRLARGRLVSAAHERPLRAYNEETFPAFEAVKASVLELLEVDHRALRAADRAAQQAASRRAIIHGLLVMVALLSLGWLSRALGRDLLDRLAELKAVAEAIAGGDDGRRVSAVRDDELGVVARQLNSVLDRHQTLEGVMQGRLSEQRQLVLGLLEAAGRPAAVVSLDGSVVASAMGEAETAAVGAAARSLPPAIEEGAGRELVLTGDGGQFSFRLLSVGGVRLVGWLVTGRD